MALCQMPQCQTTAGCKCGSLPPTTDQLTTSLHVAKMQLGTIGLLRRLQAEVASLTQEIAGDPGKGVSGTATSSFGGGWIVVGTHTGTAGGLSWLDNIPDAAYIIDAPREAREPLWRPEWLPTIFEPLPEPPRSKNLTAPWSRTAPRPQETHERPPVRADPSCLLPESSFSFPPRKDFVV